MPVDEEFERLLRELRSSLTSTREGREALDRVNHRNRVDHLRILSLTITNERTA